MEETLMPWARQLACGLLLCATLHGCSSRDVNVRDDVAARGAAGAAAQVGGSSSVDFGFGSGPGPLPSGQPAPHGQPAPSNQDPSTVEPISIDHTGTDNPAGLSPEEVEKLVAGGPLGDLKWLYPYDGTVFPRGTLAPAVMWNGNARTDAMYLRIKSHRFEYKTVLKPSATPGLWLPFGAADAVKLDPSIEALASFAVTLAQQITGLRPTQLLLPQDVWELAGQKSLGKGDTFTFELTERVDGQIRGPLISHIEIAQASLPGSVYYSSCLSAIQGENPVDNFFSGSKVLRIPAGGRAELVLSQPGQVDGQCHGCHSVSVDGSRLIAQHATGLEDFKAALGGDASKFLEALAARGLDVIGQGMSYQLGADGRPTSLMGDPVGPNASYGALYPDGSKYLSTTGLLDAGLSILWGNPPSVLLPRPATLYDAQSGAVIPDTGVPPGAAMPMFSADGRHLAFTDSALGNAHGLVVMDYDTTQHKASSRRILVQEDTAGPVRPGWPFFLPDNNAVVFTRTTDPAFSGSGSSSIFASTTQNVSGVDIFGTSNVYSSDMYLADMATGKVSLLAKAMGFNSPDDFTSNKTYLPFGAEDLHRNFFPTVLPVAAGGYFWVFFDTYRHYGSLGVFRQLWAFAIDIQRDGSYTFDPSHPPFYLPGQEFGSSNHRAFAALDPCQPNGGDCRTGVDCCGGFCTPSSDAPDEFAEVVGTCAPPRKNACARVSERCQNDGDCCPPSAGSEPPNVCISGFCAFVPLL